MSEHLKKQFEDHLLKKHDKLNHNVLIVSSENIVNSFPISHIGLYKPEGRSFNGYITSNRKYHHGHLNVNLNYLYGSLGLEFVFRKERLSSQSIVIIYNIDDPNEEFIDVEKEKNTLNFLLDKNIFVCSILIQNSQSKNKTIKLTLFSRKDDKINKNEIIFQEKEKTRIFYRIIRELDRRIKMGFEKINDDKGCDTASQSQIVNDGLKKISCEELPLSNSTIDLHPEKIISSPTDDIETLGNEISLEEKIIVKEIDVTEKSSDDAKISFLSSLPGFIDQIDIQEVETQKALEETNKTIKELECRRLTLEAGFEELKTHKKNLLDLGSKFSSDLMEKKQKIEDAFSLYSSILQ